MPCLSAFFLLKSLSRLTFRVRKNLRRISAIKNKLMMGRKELFETYCEEVANVLIMTDRALAEGRAADLFRVRKCLQRYRIQSQRINWGRSNTELAVRTIKKIMMLDPGNTSFMDLCCREEIFDNMLMFFGDNNMRRKDGYISDEEWSIFCKRMEICEKNVRICIFCQLSELISDEGRSELSGLIETSLDELSSRSFYYSVKNGMIKHDVKTRAVLLKLIENDRDDLSASFDNPVYVLVKLHKCRYILSMKGYEDQLTDNSLFRFINEPELFDYDAFDPEWWPLLSFIDMQVKIKKRGWPQVVKKLNSVKGISRPTVHRIIGCISPDEVEDPDESHIAWLN